MTIIIINFIILIYNFINFVFLLAFEVKRKKVLPKIFKSQIIPIQISFAISLIAGISLNIYIGLYKSGLEAFSYYIFSLYLLILLFIIVYIIYIKSKLIKQGYPSVIDFSFGKWKNDIKKHQKIIGLSSNIILLYAFYNNIRGFISKEFLINNNLTIEISFKIIILFALINIIAYKFSKNIRHDWLENFERKIIINEYNYEKIKEEFMKEYLGTLTQDWLKNIEKVVNNKKRKFENAINKFDEEYIRIKDINNWNDLDNIVRKNSQLYEELDKHFDEFNNALSSKIDLLNKFYSQGPITENEKIILKFIKKNWKKYIEYIKENMDKRDKIILEDREFLKNKSNQLTREFNKIKSLVDDDKEE